MARQVQGENGQNNDVAHMKKRRKKKKNGAKQQQQPEKKNDGNIGSEEVNDDAEMEEVEVSPQ